MESMTRSKRRAFLGLVAVYLPRDDGTFGEWSRGFLQLVVRYLKLESSEVLAYEPLIQEVNVYTLGEGFLLALNDVTPCMRVLMLREILVLGATQPCGYDARLRTVLRRLSDRLDVPWCELAETERALGAYLHAKLEHMQAELKDSRVWRAVKVGGAMVAGGVALGITAGAAAPVALTMLAAASGGVLGGAAIASALTLGTLQVLFGAAGAGLVGYKMNRRTAGLQELNFTQADAGRVEGTNSSMTLTICISGWVRDKIDFKRPWGVPLTGEDLTLRARLARFLLFHHAQSRIPEVMKDLKAFTQRRLNQNGGVLPLDQAAQLGQETSDERNFEENDGLDTPRLEVLSRESSRPSSAASSARAKKILSRSISMFSSASKTLTVEEEEEFVAPLLQEFGASSLHILPPDEIRFPTPKADILKSIRQFMEGEATKSPEDPNSGTGLPSDIPSLSAVPGSHGPVQATKTDTDTATAGLLPTQPDATCTLSTSFSQHSLEAKKKTVDASDINPSSSPACSDKIRNNPSPDCVEPRTLTFSSVSSQNSPVADVVTPLGSHAVVALKAPSSDPSEGIADPVELNSAFHFQTSQPSPNQNVGVSVLPSAQDNNARTAMDRSLETQEESVTKMVTSEMGHEGPFVAKTVTCNTKALGKEVACSSEAGTTTQAMWSWSKQSDSVSGNDSPLQEACPLLGSGNSRLGSGGSGGGGVVVVPHGRVLNDGDGDEDGDENEGGEIQSTEMDSDDEEGNETDFRSSIWWWQEMNPSCGDHYLLQWESEVLGELTTSVAAMARSAGASAALQTLQLTAYSALLSVLALPLGVIGIAGMIDGVWTLACERADEAGVVLAGLLLRRRQGARPVTLVGFSMGARVVFSCLKELARRQEEWALRHKAEGAVFPGDLRVVVREGTHNMGKPMDLYLVFRLGASTLRKMSKQTEVCPGAMERLEWTSESVFSLDNPALLTSEPATAGGDYKLPLVVELWERAGALQPDVLIGQGEMDVFRCCHQPNSTAMKTLRLERTSSWFRSSSQAGDVGEVEVEAVFYPSPSEQKPAVGIVETAILEGAPLGSDDADWAQAASVVSGRLVNVYSSNDWLLALVYRYKCMKVKVAGTQPVTCDAVENVDVSDLIRSGMTRDGATTNGHSDYAKLQRKILNRVNLNTCNSVGVHGVIE